MILELVTFKKPDGLTREKEYEGARHSAEMWIRNDELVAKHFLRNDEGMGGAAYIWPSRAAAERGHDAAWRADFVKRMGCEPTIQYFELMLTADAKGKKVVEYGDVAQAAE